MVVVVAANHRLVSALVAITVYIVSSSIGRTAAFSVGSILSHQHRTTTTTTLSRRPPSSVSSTRLFASDDDREKEIAKLEEQLKLLKQEKSATVTANAAEEEEVVEEVPIEMFLSEGWKETENVAAGEQSRGGMLTTILGAVAVVIFLVGFSQIPIGQEDLSKVR
jgi:hypothetical protein